MSPSFLQRIEETYGSYQLEILQTISKSYVKLAKQKNRRIFLLRCKHNDVTPNFLKLNLSHIIFTGTYLENKFNFVIKNTINKILNLTITESTMNIKNYEALIKNKINEVKPCLPGNILNDFLKFEKNKYEKIFNQIKTKNQNKLSKLISKIPQNEIKINTSKWLENLSDTQIPDDIVEVLALGKSFSLPIVNENKLPYSEYIASVETAIYDKPDPEKENIRADVVNVITNHKIKTRHNNIKTNKMQVHIQKKLNKTKTFIKNNPQIIVLEPDKSNKTVIMNSSEYDKKMNDLLNDKKTYKKLRTDSTTTLQNKNNIFIKKILNKKELSEVEAKKLIIHNAVAPKIYGLPKLHKHGVPLRPIVSCIQSPLYNLSKYLSNCLSNVTGKNEYFIKDSFSFKTFIDNIKIPNNYKLISLDVVSLYTNIPNDIITDIIKHKWQQIKEHTTLSCNSFIEGLNLTLNNNYFQYKTDFYQQLDGCAMGSPISSTVAQLVMEFVEENVLQKLDFDILFFKRYVDDCLTAIPENKTTDILNAFNKFHKKLKFTSEIEEQDKINFLDLTLLRDKKNNSLKTKWYTKPTWSGRYLNYNSQHPKNQKNSVVIGLIDRAITLTSPEHRPEILKKVKETLLNNNFPLKLINKITKQRTFKFYNSDSKNPETINNNRYIAMPYTNELSEKLKYILSKHNIIVCHKAQNLLANLYTPLKSKVQKKKKSNVVYAIPCLNCPKKYIGMTTQYLDSRLNGHKYTKNASTALHKHEKDLNHEFNFAETKILSQDTNYHKLVIKEMYHIKKDNNTVVNDRQDIRNLSQIYCNLIT